MGRMGTVISLEWQAQANLQCVKQRCCTTCTQIELRQHLSARSSMPLAVTSKTVIACKQGQPHSGTGLHTKLVRSLRPTMAGSRLLSQCATTCLQCTPLPIYPQVQRVQLRQAILVTSPAFHPPSKPCIPPKFGSTNGWRFISTLRCGPRRSTIQQTARGLL